VRCEGTVRKFFRCVSVSLGNLGEHGGIFEHCAVIQKLPTGTSEIKGGPEFKVLHAKGSAKA